MSIIYTKNKCACLATLAAIIMAPFAASAQNAATVEEAGKAYREAAKSLGGLGVTNLSNDFRTREREKAPSADLHRAFLTGVYRQQDPLPTLPDGIALLCAPQYDHKRLEDASKSTTTIGTVVGSLSEKSGKKGFQLFVHEVSTDRGRRGQKRKDEENNPSPPEELAIAKGHVEALRAFQANVFQLNSAFTNHSGLTLCDQQLLDDSELKKRMSGAHRDLCSCYSTAIGASAYFFPTYSPSQETGIVAGAVFIKSFFAALDKIFGVFASRIEAKNIKKAVHEYVSDSKTEALFNESITVLKDELYASNRIGQRNEARSYWKSYCNYADSYSHYKDVLAAANDGGDPPPPLPKKTLADPAAVTSTDLCKHIAGQRDFGATPASTSSEKSPSSRTELEDRALAAAHTKAKTDLVATIKAANGFDKAFDAPTGAVVESLQKKYKRLKEVSSPDFKGEGNEWGRLISELLWIADAIVAVDAGKTDLEKAFDELEKALSDEGEKQ